MNVVSAKAASALYSSMKVRNTMMGMEGCDLRDKAGKLLRGGQVEPVACCLCMRRTYDLFDRKHLGKVGEP